MHTKLVLLMTLTVLASTLNVAFKVQRVEASENIYILAHGLVYPSTAPISTIDNVTYTFISDISGSIIVQRSNIIIDGNRYVLKAPSGAHGFHLESVSNVTIKKTQIQGFDGISLDYTSGGMICENIIEANSGHGIRADHSSNTTIVGNSITTNDHNGINLRWSCYSTISGNNITNNYDGVYLDESNSSTIIGNIIAVNKNYGIRIHLSSDNTIRENVIETNRFYGIYLHNSSDNIIAKNSITNNSGDGVLVWGSSNNVIYHNNFVDNSQQVYIQMPGYANFLDNGYPSGGNYWSDYTGADSNFDGIGDTQYVIDSNNIDNYPLMGMFHSFNTSRGYHVNVISNSTIEDFEYFESNSTIRMHVSNMTANQTYGFCRVCIPKDLMCPPYTVVIDDGVTAVLHFNETAYANGTHIWIYFAYEHSTHEVDIIASYGNYDSLFMIATLIIIALAVTVYRVFRAQRHLRKKHTPFSTNLNVF